ncbi:MAG TPA: PEP/pyruvate-binding domain-containing protein [Kofleriaceae bacterium]|nr:PEP/pyruvate-binding domain-containing protein [Kofleriaceae bacterium]
MTTRAAVLAAVAATIAAVTVAAPPVARAAEQRVWVKGIPDDATWATYSRELHADRFGKFVIDVKSNQIYFIDVNLFELHADFVLGVLLKQAWTADNIREYNKNYDRVKPRFILGYITHHTKVDRWAFSFWEGDQIDAPTVQRVHKRLSDTFWRAKDLVFRPDSPAQLTMAKAVARLGIKVVTSDEIYKASPYQAFNPGWSVGTLRVVPVGTPYEQLTFDRGDIALLQESYPDISPVAGILSTTFSTPLSHVNLRATAWNVPNAGYKKARDEFGKLDGKVVYYQVTDAKVILREATGEEIAEYQRKQTARRKVDLPPADLEERNLPMLTRIRAKDVVKFGTKTSNLGEIRTANLADVLVPDGFGVPFYYYVRHLKQHGLDARIAAMLADARFEQDAAWRRQALEELRAAIKAAPIDPVVLDMLYKRVRLKLGGKGVFVRSSTNAEDLPGFNGAGLYDTVANVRGKAALGEAVKTVWASLWNQRAVDERALFGIDHRQVYAAVMIQVGVAATAAGVLVSTNLWDERDDDGFTINAKWGLGMRVVEGQKVPEQIIFDATNDGTKIISRADDATMLVFDPAGGLEEVQVPAGEVILTEARAKRLVKAVQQFIPLFPAGAPLDVEWVLEGETIWIVQARPYVGR